MSSDDRSDTDALFRRVHDEMIDSFDEEFEMELDDERMAKLVTDVTGDLLSQIPYEEIDRAPITLPAPPRRMSWARLLKRVFDIDIEHCPACGGALKIIAAIEEPAVMVRILTHLGLPARAPPRSPARPLALFQAA
jgi:hypothetical protein